MFKTNFMVERPKHFENYKSKLLKNERSGDKDSSQILKVHTVCIKIDYLKGHH